MLRDEIKESLNEIEILKAEIHNLKDEIKSKEEELQNRTAEEHEKEKKISEFAEKLENLMSENKALKANNELLLEQISYKHSELEKVKRDLINDQCYTKAETDQSVEIERNFTCKDCDSTFKREFDLNIHNSTKHTFRSFRVTSTKERQIFLFPNISRNIPLK